MGDSHKKNFLKKLKAVYPFKRLLLTSMWSKFIDSGLYDKHLGTLRNALGKRTMYTVRGIYRHFPEEIRMVVSKGGFLLWIQLPKGVDSIEFYKKAYAVDITILPGSICSTSDGFKEYIRISCSSPYTKKIEDGIKKLGMFINEMSIL